MTQPEIKTPKQRTALFGGAFDPFHAGHLAVIRHLLATPTIDAVLVVPSGDRPDKKGVSLARDRYEMVKLGVAGEFRGDPRVEVSDLQTSHAIGYGTIDLVRHFANDPLREVWIVIGQELLHDLPAWKDAHQLKESAKFLIIRRPGVVETSAPAGWSVVFLEPFADLGVEVSSTELREKMRRGEAVDRWVPIDVLAYAAARRLYR